MCCIFAPEMREYFKYTLLATVIAIAVKVAILQTDPLHDSWGRAAFLLIAPITLTVFIPIAIWRTRVVEFEGFASGRINAAAGVRVVLFAALFNALFDYVYFSYLNTSVIPHLADQIHAVIDATKDMPASEKAKAHEDIRQSSTVGRHVMINNFIVIGVGFFVTLVSAVALRKTKDGKPLFFSKG